LVILHRLSLNLQEQHQMKMALQNSEAVQALYKQNPQQLIEMIQHLQQLEQVAEQMQIVIS